MKRLLKKETYALQFTEEDRKKVADFLYELTGLTDISEVKILPNGMYIETTETTNSVENFMKFANDFNRAIEEAAADAN